MMAGFEVIVRPVVFPNIRPPKARTLPPEDDPEQGKCIINGTSISMVTVSENVSNSTSGNNAKETQRRSDVVRIRPSGGDGALFRSGARAAGDDDDVYIDVEVVKKIWLKTDKEKLTRKYAEVALADNIQIIESNVMRTTE